MLRSNLDNIAAELDEQMDSAVLGIVKEVVAGAKSRVPVESGDLRDAIHYDRDGEGNYRVVAGNTEAFYGHIVEFGGAHQSARPFLLPALEASRATLDDDVRDALRDL